MTGVSGRHRVAAIDCGTNSIRLLVTEASSTPPAPGSMTAATLSSAQLTEVERRVEITRLGQGVDVTGEFHPDALARTLAVVTDYAETIRRLGGVEAVRFIATSASRDARNREEFFAGVRSAFAGLPGMLDGVLGGAVEAEVISGDKEARLSFAGATSAVANTSEGPYLMVDLGGGSTELVLGQSAPIAAYSMNIGSVRLSERHFKESMLPGGAAPTPMQIAAARADIQASLDAAAAVVPLHETRTLVGLAGTITSVTALALGLSRYDRNAINGAVLPIEAVLDACDSLLRMNHAERRALGFLQPMRADVIGAGALIWFEVISRVRAEMAAVGQTLEAVTTSEHDILDGIALTMLT